MPIKDIEQGHEDELTHPLLNPNEGGEHIKMLKLRPRPMHLEISGNQASERPPLTTPVTPDLQTPSSIRSMVNNTTTWRERQLQRLNTRLLEFIGTQHLEEVKRLLTAGASPNATCRLSFVSACHKAALDEGDALGLLIQFGAKRLRIDKFGRTPLHLAAWAGNAGHVGVLVDLPEDIQDRAEEEVRKLRRLIKEMTNVRCDLGEEDLTLPEDWKDKIDHNCRDIYQGTVFQPGWTPLHVASSCPEMLCTHLLLAAGADPNITDVEGRTPLDVAGYAYYYERDINVMHLVEVINMLLKAGGNFNTTKRNNLTNMNTPLHTAVEIESLEAIQELLDAGAVVTCLNRAGQTPLHVCVKKKLEEHLQLLANYDYNDMNESSLLPIDLKDKEGYSVLQAAVKAAWLPGVYIALQAGADVTSQTSDGETSIHLAAALGNLAILHEILCFAQMTDALDYKNEKGLTALFKAVIHGHVNCVRQILHEGADFQITLPGKVNIFHVAAEYGHTEVLRVLLEFNEKVTDNLINTLTEDSDGFGPIHFAVYHNHPACVELLLSKGANIRLTTTYKPYNCSTPLHLAAIKNTVDTAKIILKFDKTTVHEVNSVGWFPLHSASHHGSRDVITLLLREGADLSGSTKDSKNTAIDMIINNLSKPTEFMEDVFDSYISSDGRDLQDPNCKVTVDYGILTPTVCEMEQMKVIEALLETGDRYGQRKLLVHPLVESFLFLIWKALLPIFYTIIALYAVFLSSLTMLIVSVFFFRDTKETTPEWLNPEIWSYGVYTTIALIVLQEVLYMNVSNGYFFQLETWVKLSSVLLAVCFCIPYATGTILTEVNWPRHVATAALLLSWLEMMFLLSRFPSWGYYVLMFEKVSTNVIKILLTFACLVIGFALSFMIQFHSQMPFESPWAALVKTIVMMTSEFDYKDLVTPNDSKEFVTSFLVIRVIFLIFLILVSIVLMNLMVGVAVNDLHNLQVLGNVRRLCKQVEFLGSLEHLVYNRLFKKILPNWLEDMLTNRKKILNVFVLSPSEPNSKCYRSLPCHIIQAIFEKAQSRKTQMDDELGSQNDEKKLDLIYKAIVKIKQDILAIKNLKAY